MIETQKLSEKTVLVCYSNKRDLSNSYTEEALLELKFLAQTAGANVVKTFFQSNDTYDSRFLIGKGKVNEIAEYVDSNKIDLVIFENELAYTQLRNLEQKIKCRIIDKSNLILDIFASNAKTAQAKLQVELAQLEYLLPRLTRMWTHLSKQLGGIGTRGPGETQIETDRRIIGKRITILKEKLKKVSEQRKTQSQERKNFVRISLVGYTNVGKSTLLNILTDSNVFVENKLFATLDTSTRVLNLPNNNGDNSNFPKKVLISDTVGFIRNLPHGLIESFKSTLAEVVESDILLHVVDVSNPKFEEQIEVVKSTLEEIGADNKKIIYVFNKVDELEDKDLLRALKHRYLDSVFVSAKKGLNISSLIEKLKTEITKNFVERTIKVKSDDYKTVSEIYNYADVKEIKYSEDEIEITVKTNKENYKQLETRLK